MNKKFRLAAVIFCLAASGWNPKKTLDECQEQLDENSRNLSVIQKNINKKVTEKENYIAQEKKTRSDIAEINRKKKNIDDTVRSLDSRITSNAAKENKLMEEMKYASLEIEDLKDYLNTDIERYYLEKSVFDYRYEPMNVGASYSLSEISYKISMIKDVERLKNEKETQMKKLADLREELGKLRSRREAEKIQYDSLEDQKIKLQQELNVKLTKAEREIIQLRESAAVMEQLITKLEQDKLAAQRSILQEELAKKRIDSLKGRLSWPIQGRVVDRYGKHKHPELDTLIINNGIKIESSSRQSVHAVARGDVVFSGDFSGYGRVVIIDHKGGYFSIYGNLGEILVKEKQPVKAFEEIGKLKSLSAKETLYFEFRTGGKAVDPLAWLEKL